MWTIFSGFFRPASDYFYLIPIAHAVKMMVYGMGSAVGLPIPRSVLDPPASCEALDTSWYAIRWCELFFFLSFRFGVVLDGERGRRPHWKSTEQLLTQAVSEEEVMTVFSHNNLIKKLEGRFSS